MEHVLQRQLLRCPLTYADYGHTWDVSDLDGGCDTWRRFQEREWRRKTNTKVYRREDEQFQLNLEKEALAKEMWEQRVKDNADREGWWLEAQDNDSPGSQYNDDEDDEDNGTIYSQAFPDPPASQEVLPSDLPLTSITDIDTYDTDPSTLESMTRAYLETFRVETDQVEDYLGPDSEAESPQPAQLAAETISAEDAEDHPDGGEFSTQHLHQLWLQQEKERQMKAIDNNRTLGMELWRRRSLAPICDWKCLPLNESYASHERTAMERPIVGRCAYERTPTIVLTTPDDEHLRLLEICNILTEDQIAAIRDDRDAVQAIFQIESANADLANQSSSSSSSYDDNGDNDDNDNGHDNDHAATTSQSPARTWWATQQALSSATFISPEHRESLSQHLLAAQIKAEVETHFQASARADALARHDLFALDASLGLTEDLASLKLLMARDGLVAVDDHHHHHHHHNDNNDDNGRRFVGREYDIVFDARVTATLAIRREEIDAVAFAIMQERASAGVRAEEDARRAGLRESERRAVEKLWALGMVMDGVWGGGNYAGLRRRVGRVRKGVRGTKDKGKGGWWGGENDVK